MLIYNTIDQSIKQSIVFANFALIGVIAKFVVSRSPFCTLGARDVSSAVSGFCQVFIVTRAKSTVEPTCDHPT